MSFKKTRLVPGKVPEAKVQEKFRDQLDTYFRQAESGEIDLYFFDPCHCVHNNVNGYEWQKKGKKGTKLVKANTGRERLNVVGALNAIRKKPHVFLTEANCDQELICMYLESLREQHPDTNKQLILILDNAPYNHSYSVENVADRLNIKLVFLPVYCPNLNLIERLWKFLKKKTKTNNYCEKFEDFQNTILHFFENLEIYRTELDQLLTPNFEIVLAS